MSRPPRDPHPVDPRRSRRPDNPDEYERGRRDGGRDNTTPKEK